MSAETDHVRGEVRHQWSRLDHGWQSYARGDVDGQYRETVREIERMALMLQQMAEALVKTADLIEEADREAAGFFSLEEAQTGSGKAPGLTRMMPDDSTIPAWERDGFGWWAEAFEQDHEHPPTINDYAEFLLVQDLSGGGQVEWEEEDWIAFHYARQAGLLQWMGKEPFPGPMSGREVLAWVEALNADEQASELVEEPEPAVPEIDPAPSPENEGTTMRVVSDVGLNLREAPGTNETVLTRIPEGAEVTVHPDTPVEEGGYLWYPVTYTPAPYASPDFHAPLSTLVVSGYEFGAEIPYNSGLSGDWARHHPGVDYAPPGGDDQIFASAGGVVAASGNQRAYGNYVIVEYAPDSVPQPMRGLPEYTEGDSVYILYAHLADTETGLPPAATLLNQGDGIGVVGSTGNSTDPHLHIEVRVGQQGLRVNTDSAADSQGAINWYNADKLTPIDPTLIFSETPERSIPKTGWVAGGTVDGTEQYLGNTGE